MPQRDLEKLLGGFATNTLTPEERSQLYKAALQDQQLFNAMADEQALKELLSDPAVRRRLLEALKRLNTSEAGGSLPWWAWFKRPAGLAFAGGLAAVIFALAFGTRIYQESLDRAAQSTTTEDAKQARPSGQAPQSADSPQSPDAKSRLNAKAPVEPTKRERSAPTTEEQYPAANAARDNAVPLRERDESRKQAQAPLTAPGKIAEQATALADKKLSAGLQAPPATPAPAAAPAAGVAAPKKSARALFYGEPSPRADTGSLAQESKQAKHLGQVKPLGLRYSFVTRGPDGQSREVSAAIAAGSKEPVRITVETT